MKQRSAFPWPEHVSAEAFKSHSNFFVGRDTTALFKSLLSIRSMVGAGMILALLLPVKIAMVLAALMTLPQLLRTIGQHFGFIQDPLRKLRPVLRGRYAAKIEGDFCVFHIGVALNGLIPSKEMKKIGDAFDAMTRELEADPEKYGYLGSENYVSTNPSTDVALTVQYWRSREHLNAYAREHMAEHFPAMLWSSQIMKQSAHCGFYHESFTVRAGDYEAVYINCPRVLLGKAAMLVPATGRNRTARGRLGITDGNEFNDELKSYHDEENWK